MKYVILLLLSLPVLACPYVSNEYDEECYGRLLGPTDWLRHGVAFDRLMQDEWWWGKGEHFFATSGGTFLRIEVYGSVWPDPDEREWLASRTAKAWAALPTPLRKASMPLSVIWGGVKGNPVYLDQRATARSRNAVVFTGDWADPKKRQFSTGFEEGLAHELCHAVDARSKEIEVGDFGYWSESGEWQRAMEADGRVVSEYAENNVVEDFAETCAAWFSTAYAPNRHSVLATTFPNRIELMKGLFGRFGQITLDAVVK